MAKSTEGLLDFATKTNVEVGLKRRTFLAEAALGEHCIKGFWRFDRCHFEMRLFCGHILNPILQQFYFSSQPLRMKPFVVATKTRTFWSSRADLVGQKMVCRGCWAICQGISACSNLPAHFIPSWKPTDSTKVSEWNWVPKSLQFWFETLESPKFRQVWQDINDQKPETFCVECTVYNFPTDQI